ncbi:dynamin family protein [Spirulina major CS-329]|uniref:dynamin family protein n=1 Tax=Spirulina TaxID=1154 RepID=UPI00232AF10D|nr:MULTISPECIES: dynamin family protein [Spirulina]MDB9494952.1 dynamin family protein [Spirulina subsalsa CS-330]MDB9502715.1 dynamin family protein [Spirulina major CS-329]
MSSQQFQAAYENLHNLGMLLVQFLQNLRAKQVAPEADRSTLRSLETDIEHTLYALHEQRYQVAVIAAMKAGKSTFLNALIGADVLASETESCTVCRTEIKPIEPGQIPYLLEYRETERHPVTIAQGDSHFIRQQFLQRTHLIRATGNRDRTTRFELYHPIAALDHYTCLNGFTLVDTPGPNEWRDTALDTLYLRETTLDALRNCEVIIFLLDYSSFKDSTNSELLHNLTQHRGEFLERSQRAVYFILNKIDRKTEEDRPIAHVIDDLRRSLQEFGIRNPVIYPASAWQGLLAKLIQSDRASETHLKDFKRFFSGRYAEETPDGDLLMPSPYKVADRALQDSLIPSIEQSILSDIVRNSGWNLLRDVAAKLDKSAHAIEDILNTRIQGWSIEIQPLRQRMEEYKRLAKNAIIQIRGVKRLVEDQEQKLVEQFRWQITDFAEHAKIAIQQEFDLFVQYRFSDFNPYSAPEPDPANPSDPPNFHVPQNLADSFKSVVRKFIADDAENPYAIHCNGEAEVEQVKQDINRFCSLLIKDWWTNTQDHLSRYGTQIRRELVDEMQRNIQDISDELSQYLGEALEISMNINPIQMLVFDFKGIDTQVQQQTENYTRWTREKKSALCRDYEVDIQVDDHRSYYEIDLRQTIEAIQYEIDSQTRGSLLVVERVIKQQVAEDFGLVEKQINDYINRFLAEFDRLLKERETREAEVDQILAFLAVQKQGLDRYLANLTELQQLLDSWRPVQ